MSFRLLPLGSPVGALASALIALGVLPSAAVAHGLDGSAGERSVLGFIPLGFEHMILGWDHLLFILGIVLLAGEVRRAAKLISIFVVGHSLTLIVATLAGWRLSPTFVDVIIALSVVYVGWVALRRPPRTDVQWRRFGLAIFAFGLVHGLGLSTRLQDLGLPDDGEFLRVVAFNVGIELGQLTVVMAVVMIGSFVIPRLDYALMREYVNVGLVAIGGFTALTLAVGGEESSEPEPSRTAARATPAATATEKREKPAACEETAVEPPSGEGGGHPAKLYYGPDEEVPMIDLQHVIGDGYVIVHYSPTLSSAQQGQIEEMTASIDNVAAAADLNQADGFRAQAAYRELTCDEFDIEALRDFQTSWQNEVESGKYS